MAISQKEIISTYEQCQGDIRKIYNKLSVKFKEESSQLPFSEWFYLQYHQIEKPLCIQCKKNTTTYKSFSRGYLSYCSAACVSRSKITKQKRIETNIQKYGVENPTQNAIIQEKRRKTNKERYGTNTPAENKEVLKKIQETNKMKYGVTSTLENPETQKKIQKTLTKRYGVNSPFLSQEVQAKAKRTILKKYNAETPLKNEAVYKKMQNTNKERYGVDNVMKDKELTRSIREQFIEEYWKKIEPYVVRDKKLEQQIESYLDGKLQSSDTWTFTCKKCNWTFQDKLRKNGVKNICIIPYTIPRCWVCYPLKKNVAEEELKQYIESFGFTVIHRNRKILSGRELDLYIPEKNLAIEFDGLLYHSFWKHKNTMFDNSSFEGEKKDYHREKTKLCEAQGIHLLHIFENEWLNPIKKDIWMSIITGKLQQNSRIYARKLTLDTDISSWEAKQFLEENHLQGYIPSSIRIGLRNEEGDLLTLMTFWKSRYGKKYTYELLRFVSKKYIVVVWGASRIFKAFIDLKKQDEVLITYADRRYSQGNVYEKLAMTFTGETKPNYFYFRIDTLELHSRVSYQKHKLEEKLEYFNPKLTETQNMYNNGYRKIYDCGNKKYIYKIIKK